MTRKIIQIKQRYQSALDQKKSYADLKRKLMEFQVGDRVMLKVSPCKGVVCFGKWGKLNPRYVGPSKVLEKVQWNSRRGPEFTWEREDQFRKKYLQLFTKTAPSSSDFGTPSERQSLGWSSEYVLRHGSTNEGRYIPADNVFSYTSGSARDDVVLDFGNSTLCRKADCVFSYTSDSSEGDISGSVATQVVVFGTCESSSSISAFEQQSSSTTNYVGHTDNARRGCPGSSMGRYFMDDNSGFEYSGHKGSVILDFENSVVVDDSVSPLLSEKVTFENVASFKAKGPAYSCNDTSEYLLRRRQSVATQGGLSINNLGSEQHLCSTSNSVEPIDYHYGMQRAQWSSVGNYSTNNSYGLRHFGNTSPVILDFQNSAITLGFAQRVSSSLAVLNNMGLLADINSSQPVGDNVGCSCDNRDLARLV
ncbi:hypothetical protein Tco_0750338 [Tanacetum coccineum]|uniref:Reverse transcriptase domain-containing protein n=1 Tax=Tanacetum coccineum TaxID=301880 RepID=A0ABQ4Z3Q9_9ASTR